MALVELNFRSKYLSGCTNVNILLPNPPMGTEPKDFYSSGKKYPVLWLLHGTGGDCTDWLRYGNAEGIVADRELIVVMPSALSANYAQWDTFANGYDAFHVLTEELMPMVYSWFPASSAREDNFIAGLSMGGRGVCTYTFAHPERFAGAYVMSASPQDMRTHLDDPFFAKRNQNMVANFGGMEGFLKSPANLWDIAARLAEEKADLPKMYFACGNQDVLAYGDWCTFRAQAEKLGFPARFFEIEGYKHEFPFWQLCLKDALARFFPDGTTPLFGE